MWKYTGQTRPPFAEPPGPGQESVWDYPRPPVIVPCGQRVEVYAGEALLARTQAALRVLETASPPTFYLPFSDIDWTLLQPAPGGSYCEWKGAARYWALANAADTVVAWAYPTPLPAFTALTGYASFYPGRVACFVDSERVRPQAGGFYGGWVTDAIVGPFKGDPGTGGW